MLFVLQCSSKTNKVLLKTIQRNPLILACILPFDLCLLTTYYVTSFVAFIVDRLNVLYLNTY